METNYTAVSVDITPTVNCQLFGLADREESYNKIHSNLEANIICIWSGVCVDVIIGIDTLFSSDALQQSIREYFTMSQSKYYIGNFVSIASHTHSAPSLDPTKPKLGKISSSYFSKSALDIAEHILNSYSYNTTDSLYMSSGSSICTENIYRRLTTWCRNSRKITFSKKCDYLPNLNVRIDHEVKFFILYDTDGAPFTVFWTWPCHPVSFNDKNAVSSDFPGAVRNEVRKYFGVDIPVLYFPGFSGDIRPKIIAKRKLKDFTVTPFSKRFGRSSSIDFNNFTNKLNKATISAITSCKHIDSKRIECSFQSSNIALSNFFSSDSKTTELQKSQRIEAISIRFGNKAVLLISAEVCSSYHKLLEATQYLFVSGYLNHVYGYLPDDKQIAEGGYESDSFISIFSLNGYFKPKIQDEIIKFIKNVISPK